MEPTSINNIDSSFCKRLSIFFADIDDTMYICNRNHTEKKKVVPDCNYFTFHATNGMYE